MLLEGGPYIPTDRKFWMRAFTVVILVNIFHYLRMLGQKDNVFNLFAIRIILSNHFDIFENIGYPDQPAPLSFSIVLSRYFSVKVL